MSEKEDIKNQIAYIKKMIDYSSRDFSKVHKVFFIWTAIFVFQYSAQIILRILDGKNFHAYSNVFFGYHRIIGLSISIICLALGTVFYFKVKHSSNYISSSIARVLLNMWFTAFILLVMNDTSNYIPFAYYYDVSFIYETTWQVILSIVVFLLTLSFTHHLTHIHAFLRINIFLILFGIASLPVTIVLVTNKIHSALLLDFSLLMSIIGFLSIALELRSVDRSHKLES